MRKMKFNLALLVAFTLVLTACSQPAATSAPESPEQSKALELYSWWTEPHEEASLNALLQVFKQQHPNVKVVKSGVPGSAGTGFQTKIASRINSNHPPDAFQVHGGAELTVSLAATGKMEPLNELFTQQGWIDTFPASLVQMVSKEGNIYAIPVNVHRSNVLWYNASLFNRYGLKPPTTFDDFFEVAEQLKQKGVTPLALGSKETWPATQLFECVLVGTLGPIDYNKLWSGHIPLDDPRIEQAFNTYKKMLSYVNPDHATRDWRASVQMVGKGEAAMTVMGDWAKAYLSHELKLKVNEEIGFATAPNTKGIFVAVVDAFGLPKGAKHPDATKKFLEVAGSIAGQDALNLRKGSIPARLDADMNKYDAYSKQAMEDFKQNHFSPSLAHGSAVPPAFLTPLNQLLQRFAADGDVGAALSAFKQAARANQIGTTK
ncbi:carbohydrate ABC transporter substrate-binding protein, CUT1 family [Laceyella tengchongensis]|uniref:Probable sugar-binding periplasmic protein n=2 Tax=Laceyella tengchongensis TaxID=574699 RepID=A0AA45WJJ0_9BACL|nr:carbohydrate ABC transporter substrate-binding protein, CUT1 family [Laceyella tengchongensis]